MVSAPDDEAAECSGRRGTYYHGGGGAWMARKSEDMKASIEVFDWMKEMI